MLKTPIHFFKCYLFKLSYSQIYQFNTSYNCWLFSFWTGLQLVFAYKILWQMSLAISYHQLTVLTNFVEITYPVLDGNQSQRIIKNVFIPNRYLQAHPDSVLEDSKAWTSASFSTNSTGYGLAYHTNITWAKTGQTTWLRSMGSLVLTWELRIGSLSSSSKNPT
jgi:hypothetical protein